MIILLSQILRINKLLNIIQLRKNGKITKIIIFMQTFYTVQVLKILTKLN